MPVPRRACPQTSRRSTKRYTRTRKRCSAAAFHLPVSEECDSDGDGLINREDCQSCLPILHYSTSKAMIPMIYLRAYMQIA